MFNAYQPEKHQKAQQRILSYGKDNKKIVMRKIRIDETPIYLVLFMPSLYLINKSDWSFFIKGQDEGPKKLEKNST